MAPRAHGTQIARVWRCSCPLCEERIIVKMTASVLGGLGGGAEGAGGGAAWGAVEGVGAAGVEGDGDSSDGGK